MAELMPRGVNFKVDNDGTFTLSHNEALKFRTYNRHFFARAAGCIVKVDEYTTLTLDKPGRNRVESIRRLLTEHFNLKEEA